MDAYICEKGSTGLGNLKRVKRAEPEAKPGEVLVRVRATSINSRDQAIIAGNYFGRALSRDTILLSDGAGEIVALGEGVTGWRLGDRVASCFFQNWPDGSRPPDRESILGSPRDGMLAQYVALSAEGVVPLPGHLSFEEGATLPCAALTAWHAVVATGHVRPGETVLTLGTGGVSIFALQFAKLAGARVIITSSSDDKLARARLLGADATINYRTNPEWQDEVLALTGGEGVDNVVEVGGLGTLNRSFKCCGYKGQVSLIGALAAREGALSPHALMMKRGRLQGIFVGHRAMFKEMNAAIAVNGLKPVVDRAFDFTDAPAAFQYEAQGRHFGKVVIKVA
jgi:NADPH:quinone reductase-like Zn-dependent oxidoreductase